MNSITYVGMDVHTTNYTLCAFTLQGQTPFAELQIKPEIKELEKYLTMLNSQLGGNCRFQCGYEAGCLGYSLYHEINSHKWKGFAVECVILAPTTIAVSQKNKVRKNDLEDARRIARCLCFGQYSRVYVPTDEDNAVKEYIRMRDDAQTALEQTKYIVVSVSNFNPRSPWGERLGAERSSEFMTEFQSTLPVGGATGRQRRQDDATKISIHAPRRGSDDRVRE